MRKIQKIFLPATATALIAGQTGCDKDELNGTELTLTERLVGEWKITEADGDIEDLFFDPEDDYNYEIHLEFHLEGDFEFSSVEENNFKYVTLGDWEWANSDKNEIEVSFNESDAEMYLTIDTFEGDEITGEMEFEYDEDKYDGDVVLERVYIDNSALLSKSGQIKNAATDSKSFNRFRDFIKNNGTKE